VDYVDRQAEEAPAPFTRELYGGLRDRIRQFENGDPETQVPRMTLRDFGLPAAILAVILVYYLAVVGIP
jgi:hypothetical protein